MHMLNKLDLRKMKIFLRIMRIYIENDRVHLSLLSHTILRKNIFLFDLNAEFIIIYKLIQNFIM